MGEYLANTDEYVVKQESTQGEYTVGWKQVAMDVYRTPECPEMLCALVGTGVQCATALYFLLGLILLGMICPDKHGGWATPFAVLLSTSSIVCGSTSSVL